MTNHSFWQTTADTQLRDWVAKDATLVDELYDEDLRRAIEISKVEYEKNGQSHGETQAPPTFTASNDQVTWSFSDKSSLLIGEISFPGYCWAAGSAEGRLSS